MTSPCAPGSYRRSQPKRPARKIRVSMSRRVEKGDLVSLEFITSAREVNAEVKTVDISIQEAKTTPEILEFYRNLVDVFSKTEVEMLPSHRGQCGEIQRFKRRKSINVRRPPLFYIGIFS